MKFVACSNDLNVRALNRFVSKTKEFFTQINSFIITTVNFRLSSFFVVL